MLKDKALEKLAAGELLLERGLLNAAASRFYYAMHQAAVVRLDLLGLHPSSFQSGAERWEHATIANNASRLRGRRADRGLYTDVMELRVQADYLPGSVRADVVRSLSHRVRVLVEDLTK